MACISDLIESSAGFLARAEHSPMTIKNYHGDLAAIFVRDLAIARFELARVLLKTGRTAEAEHELRLALAAGFQDRLPCARNIRTIIRRLLASVVARLARQGATPPPRRSRTRMGGSSWSS